MAVLARILPVLLLPNAIAAAPQADPPESPPAAAKVDFATQILPILQARCTECHGGEEPEADLRLDAREGLFHAERDRWVVVPGNAEESLLWQRISLPADDPDIMPAEGEPLTAEQIALIKRWIEEGADWPAAVGAAPADAAAATPEPALALEVPALSDAAAAACERALAALRARGASASPVAANTAAVEVNLSLLGRDAGDDDLALLAGLEPVLVWLDAGRTALTDAGVRQLARFSELRRLSLAGTGATDAGLAALGQLGKLEYLNLYGTAVTDAGLEALRGLAALRRVFLWQTAVTEEGAARLRQLLPGVQVDLGRYVDELREVTAKTTPRNARCPVLTDKDVDPAYYVEHEGVVVGFCCGKCRTKFTADPAQFAARVAAQVAAAAAAAPGQPRTKEEPPPPSAGERKPANERCLVSGEAVDPAHTVEHDGVVVGFCCGKCRAKFAADPAQFAEALRALRKQPPK